MYCANRKRFTMSVLLLATAITTSLATKPEFPLVKETEHKMYIAGKYPKVGEVFEVVYQFRFKPEISPPAPGQKYYVKFVSQRAEVLTPDEITLSDIVPGQWREVRGQFKITRPFDVVYLTARLTYVPGSYGPAGTSAGIVLLDRKTGQYGKGEDRFKPSVLWRYNNVEPQWLPGPDAGWEESNRKIVDAMKKYEPTLSDSEALCLHQEHYVIVTSPIWKKFESDSARITAILREGWLAAIRSGADAKQKWSDAFMKKYLKKKDVKTKARREAGCDLDTSPAQDQEQRTTTTFTGTWVYQDHLYDELNGLKWDYETKAIKTAETGVRAWWYGQGAKWVAWGSTSSSGSFNVTTIDIPSGAEEVYAYPIVFTWGPVSGSEAIKVSDPSPFHSTWMNPDDTTIWFLARPSGTNANSVTPGGTCNFGTCFVETAKTNLRQPPSGAVNIFQQNLSARAFVNPAPDWPLRIMWDTGYTRGTMYRSTDTIWVNGDTITDSDEWDDDLLCHEFGHYLMRHYARLKPETTTTHYFWKEYPNDKYLAYQEGWASFFSGRARSGLAGDTLIIDTKKGIGKGEFGFFHLEDPWLCSGTWPDSFQGGAWCEGAVAGVLWDAYDSYNEKHRYYPKGQYTDTTYDSLTTSFDNIWEIFDDYDPPGNVDTSCGNIYQFRSGWKYYGYNYLSRFDRLLYHHYISADAPAKPTGLVAWISGMPPLHITVTWRSNTEPDLWGYQVFRQDSVYDSPFMVPRWSPWAFNQETYTPDTSVDDYSICSGTKYRYKINAFDSLGNISVFSDSVEVSVDKATTIAGSDALGLTEKTVCRDISELVVYVPEKTKGAIVKIYDRSGRMIARQRIRRSGYSKLELNGRSGGKLASGVYFVDLTDAKKNRLLRKVIVVR